MKSHNKLLYIIHTHTHTYIYIYIYIYILKYILKYISSSRYNKSKTN